MPVRLLCLLCLVSILSALVAALSAVEGELEPERLGRSYKRLVLQLDGAPPDGKGLRVTLGMLGDDIVQSWAESPRWPGHRLLTMHHEVTVKGGALGGTFFVQIVDPSSSGARFPKDFNSWWGFALQANVGDRIGGKYQAGRSHPKAEAAQAAGAIKGATVPWDAWLRQHPLAKESDYPQWRGRFGNGTARDTGWELVDDLAAAEVLWVSEEDQIPDCYGMIMGGVGGPVVSDGKLYFSYALPDGPHYDAEEEADHRAKENPTARYLAAYGPRAGAIGERWVKRRFSIEADEIVVCVDAQTGLTRWRRVFPAAAHNPSFQGRGTWKSAKNGPFNTPCVADGRVYVNNRHGMLRCLDADTGETLWQQGLGCHAHSQEHLAQAIAAGKQVDRVKQRPGAVDFNSSPVVIDGVVVCNANGGGAVGFDARSGKRLWGPVKVHADESTKGSISALPITIGGRTLCIFAGGLLDPRSGKVVWEVPASHYIGNLHPAISGDVVVFGNDRKNEASDITVSAWRMSADGAEKLWEIAEPGRYAQTYTSPTIYQGHLYLTTYGSKNQKGKHESHLIDLQTGEMLGRAPNERGDGNFGHFLAGDGKVLIPSLKTSWWRADPQRWERLCEWAGGDTAIDNGSCHPPAMCGGRLYVRGSQNLFCLDLRQVRDDTPPPALTGR